LIILAVVILLKTGKSGNDEKFFKMLQNSLFDLNKTVDSKITETNRFLDRKLTESNKHLTENMTQTFATTSKISEESNKRIEAITKKLTELGETNKQIQDIGSQLRGLENVLKNPKQRGNL